MKPLSPEAIAVIEGRHADPFRYLGPQVEDGRPVLRVFIPDAMRITALWTTGRETPLTKIHPSGLFSGDCADIDIRYRLRVEFEGAIVEIEDPYRFPPLLTDYDLHLLAEGSHFQLYDRLGAHPIECDGVAGVSFAVLAPDAQRVSVVGDFNSWDGRRHMMRVRGNGYWEIFAP
ncbi:MAG TPA: 1,4-alpha-glucan branching enzyme, partial [Xanthobacteraceae bacterium]|nr:1,4-alpha-glucan branching enzyme [Xanthobacteraceae bacterium]